VLPLPLFSSRPGMFSTPTSSQSMGRCAGMWSSPKESWLYGCPTYRRPPPARGIGRSSGTPPVPIPAGAVCLAFSRHLLSIVGSTLWFPEGTPPEQIFAATAAALSAVQGFAPRDPVEGMMAAQAVALHHAAMECFWRAMIPAQPFEVTDRLRRQGANLSRAMVDMAEAIDRRRGKGPQVVRVERVVVQDGGQAIVGAIAPGGRSDAK